MNNITQKNIIQKIQSNADMPYLCADFASLHEMCKNTNAVEMNNMAQQLLDNDLYLEAQLNAASSYVVGPKIYDETAVASMPDGYKVYGSIRQADCLDILKKVEDPLSSTLKRVTSVAATKFLCQYGSYVFTSINGALAVSEDPSSKPFNEVFTNAGDRVDPTNWTLDNDNLFFCTKSSAYQLSSTHYYDSQSKTMKQQFSLVELLAEPVSAEENGEINAIAVNGKRRLIALGTSRGVVLVGQYTQTSNLEDSEKSVKLKPQEIYTTDRLEESVKSMHFLQDDKKKILYVGTEKGAYVETEIAGFEGQEIPDPKPPLGASFTALTSFNNEVYIGSTEGLWRKVEKGIQKVGTFPSEKILNITSDDSALFIVTDANKIYRMTSESNIEDEVSKFIESSILDGKTITVVGVIGDLVFFGTSSGDVYYYTQNDSSVNPFLLVSAGASIVDLACSFDYITVATENELICYEIASSYLVDTRTLKSFEKYGPVGAKVDSEVKRIITLGRRTFAVTSTKIFEIGGTLQWNGIVPKINDAVGFQYNREKYIAVAGNTNSYVLQLGSQQFSEKSLGGSEGNLSASSVAVTSTGIVLLGTLSSDQIFETNVYTLTFDEISQSDFYPIPSTTTMRGRLIKVESAGDSIYVCDQVGQISTLVQFQPAVKSTEFGTFSGKAFIGDQKSDLGFMLVDEGISCISAGYVDVDVDGDHDGEVTPALTAQFAPGSFTSMLMTSQDNADSVLLLGSSAGLKKAVVDQAHLGDENYLIAVKNAIANAQIAHDNVKNATSLIECPDEYNRKQIFAATSNGEVFGQYFSWETYADDANGTINPPPTNLLTYARTTYLYFDDTEEKEGIQQIYSTNSGTFYKRNGVECELGSSEPASKIVDCPIGIYILKTSGELKFFYEEGNATTLTDRYVSLPGSSNVKDTINYEYMDSKIIEGDTVNLGVQLVLKSNGELYTRQDASWNSQNEVVYSFGAEVLLKSFGSGSVPTNCDIYVDEDHGGYIIVAMSDGKIWLAQVSEDNLPASDAWLVGDTGLGQIEKAWLVSTSQIAVWTSSGKIYLLDIASNDTTLVLNNSLEGDRAVFENVSQASKSNAAEPTSVVFAVSDGKLYEVVTRRLVDSSISSFNYAVSMGATPADIAAGKFGFATSNGLEVRCITESHFSKIDGVAIKHISTSNGLILGVGVDGKLKYCTDQSCETWNSVTSSPADLIGCKVKVSEDLAEIYAWSSTKIYRTQHSLNDLSNADLVEWLDASINLGSGSSFQGMADDSVYNVYTERGQNILMQFAAGDEMYTDELVLANKGLYFFNGSTSVRVVGSAIHGIRLFKSSYGKIWYLSGQGAKSLYTIGSNEAKYTCPNTISNGFIDGDLAAFTVCSTQFEDYYGVIFGKLNLADDTVEVDSEIPAKGLLKVTAVGQDANGRKLFGVQLDQTTYAIVTIEFFQIKRLETNEVIHGTDFQTSRIVDLVQNDSDSSFAVICRESSNQSLTVREYKPIDGSTWTYRRFLKRNEAGNQIFITDIDSLCFMNDNSGSDVLALIDGGTALYHAQFNEMLEYENASASSLIAAAKVKGRYYILCDEKLVSFDRYGKITIYDKIVSAGDRPHFRFLENGSELIAAAGTYLEKIESSKTAVVLKAAPSGCQIKTIASAVFDDQIQRWFYVLKNGATNDVYVSTNLRIWKYMFSLKSSLNVGDINDLVVVNKNIFVFAGSRGVYSTCYSWKMAHDVRDFNREDALDLYEEVKDETIIPKLNDALAEHEFKDHGIQQDDINKVTDLPLITQLNSKFSSVDLDDLEPTWQRFNQTETSLAVDNDIIAEMTFGTYKDGSVLVRTSSFIDECREEETRFNDQENASFIMKRWMSGITDLYINIPTTGTKYLNNLYGAAGCTLAPETVIERANLKNSECGADTDGQLSSHYTTIEVGLASTDYTIDQLLDIQINGNSLPLDIYKDQSGNAGQSRGYYSSFIEPSVARSWNTTTTDEEGNWLFRFACFGTDAQAVHLMFYDSRARSGAPFVRVLFDSNGGEGEMPKQKFLLFGSDPARYVLEQKPLRKNRFKNFSAGYEKIFTGWSLVPRADNYSGSDVLDGSQVYQDSQQFPVSRTFEDLMTELGRGGSSEGLEKKEEITLYAVWLTYQFSETDTRLVMNSTKEKFKIGSIGVDESTNLKGTVIVDFGD